MGNSGSRKPWKSEPWLPQESSDFAGSDYSIRRRITLFGFAVFLLFGILTLQLARMQLAHGSEYRQRAETNRLREVPLIPIRGLIYDRNGVALVENRASYSAGIVAADVPKDEQTQITIVLQELTGVPASEIDALIEARRRSNDPFAPAIFKENLGEEKAFLLREQLANLPGARVVVEAQREYTKGALVAHVLGFVGPLDADDYAELAEAGYQFSDQIGKTGIEAAYEATLRGIPGSRQVEADASGRELSVINEQPAVAGGNLILTIALELQSKVEEFLRDAMGESLNAAAVVMDVKTGEILALVSLPAYDNNIFSGEVDEEALLALLEDPGKPLLNHAIAEMYPPGSTFKQVTGLAALEEGVATAATEITSEGVIYVENEFDPSIRYAFRDWAALGTLNFYRGVAMSSDIYFYYLAGGYSEGGEQIFEGLGANLLSDWARRFGLGEQSGIDLPGESEGLVPDPNWKEQKIGEPWVIGDTYFLGIGQGYMAATPIQMLLVTAAIANGGNILVPHLVTAIQTAEGEVLVLQRQTIKRNLNIDLQNLDIMREGMRQAIDSGSATSGQSSSVVIAGKTGTAEFGLVRPDGSFLEHGWFTGYAPFGNPEIAVVVFLEQGGGALTAAPVASKILSFYFDRQNAAFLGPQ